jgi:protein O-GlcNAc transferase
LTPAALGELALLMNAGSYAELESKSRQLLERHPDTGIVWQLLGIALRMQAKDPLAASTTRWPVIGARWRNYERSSPR